jgi:uncharacterized integral membrane protein (TIGR00697 family)
MKKHFKHFDLILAFFVLALLVSNLAATKLISVGPLILDGGAILFPLTYILGDVLTEVYGYRYAKRAIWAGFAGLIIAVGTFTIVQHLPYPADYTSQSAYESVLGFLPRIVLASLTAYTIGQFLNSFILAKIKVKMKGEKLWLRLIGSTFVAEFADTVIFCLIAFGGILSGANMLNYILVGWLFKLGVEIILLPITYRVVSILKESEHSDAYDKKTDFNPFSATVSHRNSSRVKMNL